MNTNKLTAQLSQLIFEAHPSDAALQQAKQGVLDYVISSYAAREDQGTQKLLHLLEIEGGNKRVPLIGLNKSATPQQAALVNGFLGHALDLDDVHTEVRGHPSTVILPVLLSIGATQAVTGRRFLAAYCVGVEVMARFGQSVTSNHYEKGWHNTSTLGVFAATAAGAYLQNLPSEKIAQALGFAATQASGLRLQFGTETKPLHAGLAARAAVLALQLTEAEFNGSLDCLNGSMSFFARYDGKEEKTIAQNLLADWQKEWRIVEPGLWFKIYPFCSAAYYGADAALQIGAVPTEQIDKITIVFSNNSDSALVYKNPVSGEEGRFSIEYIVALILSGKRLSHSYFENCPITSEVTETMEKIQRLNQPIKESEKRFTSIQVSLKNGKTLEAISYFPKGSPKNRVTLEELIQKGHHILNDASKEKKWQEVILSLDQLEDLTVLFELIK